jgi:hypothetical protein
MTVVNWRLENERNVYPAATFADLLTCGTDVMEAKYPGRISDKGGSRGTN